MSDLAELETLWALLSAEGRKLLTLSSEELAARNAATRQLYDAAAPPNPLRWMWARKVEEVRTDDTPSLKGLSEADAERIRALGFHPSGCYENYLCKTERWVGPCGCVVLELGEGKRFFVCILEGDHKVSMGKDDAVAREVDKRQPEHTKLYNTDDIVADYARLLEAVAAHSAATGARPHYRHRDHTLDLAGMKYYDRHVISNLFVGHIFAWSAVQWTVDKMDIDVEGLASSVQGKAEGMAKKVSDRVLQELEVQAKIHEDGVVFACVDCGKRSRVAFAKIGSVGKCGHCQAALETAAFPLDVESTEGLNSLLGATSKPILVDYWAPWCGPCVAGMPALIRAAKESDGAFLVVRLNGDRFHVNAQSRNVQAFPTMIRYVDGQETDRSVGAKQAEAIRRFALDS